MPELVELAKGTLGVPAVGAVPELKAVLDEVDLVIAKGSANYETFQFTDLDVYYLLRAKCHPVAQSLGVQLGGLVLLREQRREPTPE